MNATAGFARSLTGLLPESPLTIRNRLIAAMKRYDNEDCVSRESAVEAICSGKAAYWTTARYSSARAADLPLALNRGVSIETALIEAYPEWMKDKRIGALETIVPLNRLAANNLSEAYEAYGSWRDAEELERRAGRAA